MHFKYMYRTKSISPIDCEKILIKFRSTACQFFGEFLAKLQENTALLKVPSVLALVCLLYQML